MKLTTMAVGGLVTAYILYRLYGFIKRRKATAPAAKPNHVPAAAAAAAPILAAAPIPALPHVNAPVPAPAPAAAPSRKANGGASSVPPPTAVRKGNVNPGRGGSVAAKPPPPSTPQRPKQTVSLDDQLDGFLGEMQQHEQRLRKMRAAGNGPKGEDDEEEKEADYAH